MLSRVADALYWMCRYVERAENVARFIDVNRQLGLDLHESAERQWRPVVATTGDIALFEARHPEATEDSVTEFLTFAEDYPNSIAACLHAARENARSIREIISSEMWEQINTLNLFVREGFAAARPLQSAHHFYRRVKMSCHLFEGLMASTMSHNEAWHFGRLGQFLERADKTARIVDIKYFILLPSADDIGTPFDSIQWAALLKSASGFEMYRKKWRRISADRVVDFLLLDAEFPRSVRFCVTEMQRSLHAITGNPPDSYQNTPERLIGQLRSELGYAHVREIVDGGLHEFIDSLESRLNAIDGEIFTQFLSLATPRGAKESTQ
jgi:uncharacterized alpha-E superfamily protein